MTGLLITILTFTMFKTLNQEKPGKVLVNLCTALILLNVIFLVATVNVGDYSDGGCIVVGVLLHYLVLASLMWMLVEAVGIYQALVIVFITYQRFHLLKRCLVAWGVPVLIVAVTAAVDNGIYSRNQATSKFCLMTIISTSAFYASLVAPACVILFVNILVFIRVVRIILRPNNQNQLTPDKRQITLSQVRGAFTVMCLLGVTWVFGPLAIGDAQTVFNYLFCICNSFQGFAIFVFRCLFHKEARLSWMYLLQKGTFKSRRGPFDSAVSDFIARAEDRRYSSSNTSGVVGDMSSRNTSTSTASSRHDSCSLPQNYFTATACLRTSIRQGSLDNSDAILDAPGVSLSRLPTKLRRRSLDFVSDPLVTAFPRYSFRSSVCTDNVNLAYDSEFTHL
ncbi:unnamed protein product [Candidula unifasciata]|uniref:G-protein coupled receptors family 2 profile 2 domain-containing protein n=1 Tax=Candidula unifasciata TaxID=100452 RepID=A0A8S3YXZ9_9EUPU|nr:unnamed protein product [Candidula unifasciata]